MLELVLALVLEVTYARRLGGTSTDVSAAFTALGRKFFSQEQSLIAYPADPANMVWSYGPHSGLVQTPVPTSIFCQVMAMRNARTALAADPSNRMALAVFVAADLRRENQIGAGETDPFAVDIKFIIGCRHFLTPDDSYTLLRTSVYKT